MSTKIQLLKEADGLQKQADQLRQRRKALKEQKAAAEENIKKWTADAASALLEERDASKVSEGIGRARVDLDTLNGAIEQADAKIRELAAEAEFKREQAKTAEAGELVSQAERLVAVDALELIRSLVEKLDTAEELYQRARELSQIAALGDRSVILHDQVFRQLKESVLRGPDGLAVKARDLENAYFAQIGAVRGK